MAGLLRLAAGVPSLSSSDAATLMVAKGNATTVGGAGTAELNTPSSSWDMLIVLLEGFIMAANV